MVDPYTSRAEIVACASAIKTKLDNILGDSRKICYEEQKEDFYPGKIFQRSRGTVQTSNQIHYQVSMAESTKKTQEE